ncbi:MAG: LPS export ABC transporter permease LptG [Gammaproteobacteria bacterium]|nr:MAG: LPS export ABC transporter permease LptG [Gammaproteobacteria bacterium]TDJ40412.1 MAG: LPS export ABC transporter permease LptG [Gammaproteobacteria bacterium]
MFNQIDRYIGKTVLLATFVALLAFIGIISLFTLVDEVREGKAGYVLKDALWYLLLTLPRRGYEVLPYVVFLGSLIGVGSLASRSEIVVLRAAGVSVWRVFLSVVWPALLVLTLGAIVGEYLAPWGEEQATAHKARSSQGSEVISLRGGYWYREGRMYMNVAGFGENGELIGVRQSWFDEQMHLKVLRRAARAEFVVGEDSHWRLFDVMETRIDETGTQVERFDELRWDGRVDPRLLSVRVLVEPRKLSLSNLYYQIEYMVREGLNPSAYQLAFWGKILQPFSVLGLALLAFTFVLGPLREVGIGVRLSVGILVGLAFKYLQDLFAPMSIVYDLPTVLAVALPIGICWAVGCWGVRRVA